MFVLISDAPRLILRQYLPCLRNPARANLRGLTQI